IKDVVSVLASYFEMQNKVVWNPHMPNGRQYYEVDLSRLKSLGFQPKYSMEAGLQETCDWFYANSEQMLIRQ
ncbi:MAG: hypothetical protein ACHQT8_06880, partial [Chlamydiales bacterium]